MIKPELDDREWQQFRKKIKTTTDSRAERIAAALSDAAELVVDRAKTHYLTGAALRVQTGRLRSSVTKTPSKGALHNGIIFQVLVGSNVWYGKMWEEGFKIPAYTIYPRVAKALRFTIGGRTIFAKKVNIPARTVAARPWLGPAVDDSKPAIINLLTKAGVILK